MLTNSVIPRSTSAAYISTPTSFFAASGKLLASSAARVFAGENNETLIRFAFPTIYPVLQTQDGSYAGYVGIGPSPGLATQYNMVAFNQSGSVIWSVPNDYPQIATADGGVVGSSGITYDNQGRATGQTVSPTQSWTGNVYQINPGQAQQMFSVPAAVATPPYSSFAGANQSGNGTAPLCGAASDQIVAQYGQYCVGDSSQTASANSSQTCANKQKTKYYPRFTPNCFEFTNTAHSAVFTFADLNTNSGGAYALIKNPLVVPSSSGYGLDEWIVAYQSSRTINSAYRTPAHNFSPSVGGATASRHMLGDAVDLSNVSGGIEEWVRMVNAAGGIVSAGTVNEKTVPVINTGAKASWIEPRSGPCALACTHADWRYRNRGKYAH